jgi:hypothetical protein
MRNNFNRIEKEDGNSQQINNKKVANATLYAVKDDLFFAGTFD